MSAWRSVLVALVCTSLAWTSHAHAEVTNPAVAGYMAMLQKAIAFHTVKGPGNQTPAFAQYLAGQLEAAGFARSAITFVPVGNTTGLVVRYAGRSHAKPVLFSSHMDVVAAPNPSQWIDHDPFKLVERDGYLYGRGIADIKDQTVAFVTTFMRLKREGFTPAHDLILVLSGDEETDQATTRILARRFSHADFMLNADAFEGIYDHALKPVMARVELAEKTYADFVLKTTSPGGHSSEPPPANQNAIVRLARAVDKVATHAFPIRWNDVTLQFMQAQATHADNALAQAMRTFAAHPGDAVAAAVISKDPSYVGLIRTTCVPTLLSAGQAPNALPEVATANVNCRIYPGVPTHAVQAALEKIIGDPTITVTEQQPISPESPVSPLRADVMQVIHSVVHARFPGLAVAPSMDVGTSDSVYFRRAGVPSYGINPVFAQPGASHMHGINERILKSEVPASLDFWYRLMHQL